MGLLPFKIIQMMYLSIIFVIHPVILVLRMGIPSLATRFLFELKGPPLKGEWDLVFEVSSEGELEQVWPIIEEALQRQKAVLLLYASPSVDSKCQELDKNYTGLTASPLPLLTLFPFFTPWSRNLFHIKTHKLYMCRYDFYPHLLLFAMSSSTQENILVSATLKGKFDVDNKRRRSFIWRYYQRKIFSLFDRIYAASHADVRRFKIFLNAYEDQGRRFRAYDFRQIQILKRLEEKNHTLSQTSCGPLVEFLNTLNMDKLILGSAWPAEMQVFKGQHLEQTLSQAIATSSLFAAIAPHQLSASGREQIKESFGTAAPHLPLFEWREGMEEEEGRRILEQHQKTPGVHVIMVKGILCELYAEFSHAFVGGGHGRSIHSVLEPYLAGCQVFCGPKTHRSTEYDTILGEDSSKIRVVEDLDHFYSILAHSPAKQRAPIFSGPREEFDAIIHRELDEKLLRTI